jgi:hypothetical protein
VVPAQSDPDLAPNGLAKVVEQLRNLGFGHTEQLGHERSVSLDVWWQPVDGGKDGVVGR